MDKKEYKAGIKKLKEEQKESKTKYKSERTPRKEVVRAAITKAGKKIFHTREELRTMKTDFNKLLDSLRKFAATGAGEDEVSSEEYIKSIVEDIKNV